MYFYPQSEFSISVCACGISYKSRTRTPKRFRYQSLQVYPSNFPLIGSFLVTPSPKTSKIQIQTCLAFKTVRLEFCPKPIQKNEPISVFRQTRGIVLGASHNWRRISQKSGTDFPKIGVDFPKIGNHPRQEQVLFLRMEPFFQREMSITQQRLTAFPLHVHVR